MTALPTSAPASERAALIVGATAGLGRALAERFASAGYHLILTGRDGRDLTALGADLRLRHGRKVAEVIVDLSLPPLPAELRAACADLAPLEAILLPAGFVRADDTADLAAAEAAQLMNGNCLGLMEVIRQIRPLLDPSRPNSIVGFGSIAAARGRSRNVHYGAAKRALVSYFESLRHTLASGPTQVQFYIPGYLDTALAAGLPVKLPKAQPDALARLVMANLHRNIGSQYFPRWWLPLCSILQLMPWRVFRKLRF